MIEIEILGFGQLRLACLVLDYNGALVVDDRLLFGVRERLERLAEQLTIHIIASDVQAALELLMQPLRLVATLRA